MLREKWRLILTSLQTNKQTNIYVYTDTRNIYTDKKNLLSYNYMRMRMMLLTLPDALPPLRFAKVPEIESSIPVNISGLDATMETKWFSNLKHYKQENKKLKNS